MKMLIDYLPPIIKKIKEMQEICKAEQQFFDDIEQEIENILCRVFISLADKKGIERFESIYGITPAEGTTLEQRRINILIRNIKKNLSLSEIMTILYNYTVKVELKCDYNNDEATIILKDEVTDIALIYKALDEIVPLNIYIKTKLLTDNQINIYKNTVYEKMYYNYALGAWSVGKMNFGERGEKQRIGGDNVNIQTRALAGIAETLAGDIKRIVVNETQEITEFTVNKTDTTVIVNYHIRAADTEKVKKVSFLNGIGEEIAILNVDLELKVDIEITNEFEIGEVAA